MVTEGQKRNLAEETNVLSVYSWKNFASGKEFRLILNILDDEYNSINFENYEHIDKTLYSILLEANKLMLIIEKVDDIIIQGKNNFNKENFLFQKNINISGFKLIYEPSNTGQIKIVTNPEFSIPSYIL